MDWDSLGRTLLVVLLVGFAVIGLATIAGLIYVIVRYRPSTAAIAAVVGALIYGASPIDLIPEALVGPLGTLDDLGLLAAAIAFMAQQIRKRRGSEVGPGGRQGAGERPVIITQLPDDH